MSSGHRTGEAARPGTIVRMLQNSVALHNFLGNYRQISRKYLVPYGAGCAVDGSMVYIDEGIPKQFKMGVEPDKYVAAHESFEWWLMTRAGMKYWIGPGLRSAHYWATGYEHYLLAIDNWSDDDIGEYEEEWLTYITEDEAERLSPETVPPDLYTGPYEPGMDNDPGEEEISAKILPILRTARARMLEVREARLME
jgi:hypothetical protein